MTYDLVIDNETDVVFDGRRKYLDPWTKGTALVSVGVGTIVGADSSMCLGLESVGLLLISLYMIR